MRCISNTAHIITKGVEHKGPDPKAIKVNYKLFMDFIGFGIML